MSVSSTAAGGGGDDGGGGRTFALPSMTVEHLQRLRATEEREERREAARIDAIEQGNFDLPGPGMARPPRYQLPDVDEQFDRRLGSLQQLVGAEQNRLQPVTPPMYRLTPAQRQGIYSGINFMAELIERNAVRPNDEQQLKLLRRMEAAAHATTSATSPSIYKTGVANLRYAQQNPRSWLDAKGAGTGGGGAEKHNFVNSEQSSSSSHAHSLEDTLFIDVRAAMVRASDDPATASVVQQPTPAMIKQVQFPYFMMLRDERRSLQYHSQHGAFLNYANTLYRESLLSRNSAAAGGGGGVHLFGDIVRRSMRESGLSLVCAQFRYDARTIEVVLKINVEASYFGLLAFNIVDDVAPADARKLRLAVKEELAKVYTDDLQAATIQQPTLGRLRDQKEQRQAMSEIAEFQHLACEYCKSHEELAADKTYGTRVDRLIARSSPMRVLMPLKSPTLCGVRVRYCYAYFANCQCFIDDDDIGVYKLRHASIARAQRAAPARRSPSELLPVYDSDDETARIDSNKRRRVKTAAAAAVDDDDADVDDKIK